MSRGNGSQTPETVATPSAQVDYRSDLPMYSGAVEMRPDVLLEALLLAREAPALMGSVAPIAAKAVMSGVKALRGSGSKALMGGLDEASSAFLKRFNDYDEALRTYQGSNMPDYPFSDAQEIAGFTRLARSGVTPEALRAVGQNQAAAAMRNLVDDGLIDISEAGMRRAAAASRAQSGFTPPPTIAQSRAQGEATSAAMRDLYRSANR